MNFIKRWLKRKVTWGTIVLIIVAGYFAVKIFAGGQEEVSYQTTAVTRGTLTVSVSGTGQVSALSQIDIKPKVSGDIVYIGVQNGQTVKVGDVVARIDSSDAQKTVRDAEISLETAQLSLNKLKQPADALTLLQAENNLAKAKENKADAETALEKAYNDGFNDVTDAFLDLPSAMSGLQDVLYSSTLGTNGEWNIDYYYSKAAEYDLKAYNFKTDTQTKLEAARLAYDKNFQDYKSLTRSSPTSTIESIIQETYDTAVKLSEAVTSANNLIQFYVDKLTSANKTLAAAATTHLSELNSYTGKINGHLTSLLSAKNTIISQKQAIVNAQRSIDESAASLDKLVAEPDALDLRSSELSVQQKQNALLDAKEKLSDYTLRASIGGTIAAVSVKKGDNASSGTSVATLISPQQMVEISLNEVDVPKVKTGQKAVLTFDAIEELTITGTVAEVDSIGTATQGVVNYVVKIAFDTQDERVKPGMSVSADIITEAKPDVLLVSGSAVKTQGNYSYVEILENGQPQAVLVTVGSSNDTMVEITSGLSEGQEIITQTISNSQTSLQSSGGNSFGAGMGGGEMMRIMR